MKKFGVLGLIKNLDIFGTPVPSFNIDGETSVKTWSGACTSIIIFMLTCAFGLIKLQDMFERKNPMMTTNTERLEADESVSINLADLMMAFSFQRSTGGEYKYGQRYVKFIAEAYQLKNSKTIRTYYPLHPCSDEEFDKFYPDPNELAATTIIGKQKANKNLFCLHPDLLEFYLQGSYTTGNDYTAIDVQLVSCASSYVLFDGTEQAADDDCVWDQQEVNTHIGPNFNL